MSAQRKRQQAKEGRLEIVAKLYKRGYSYRQIQAEVMERLSLKTYGLRTVCADVHTLLAEWRETRLENMDEALQLELERIDETVRELWEQWEKSKDDYTHTVNTRKGAPSRNASTGASEIKPYSVEIRDSNVVGLGNPSYISEIRAQLAERRKLLGLYAPEKRQVESRVDGTIELAKMTEDEIRAEIARITGSIENR